jgi:hypothetical protein
MMMSDEQIERRDQLADRLMIAMSIASVPEGVRKMVTDTLKENMQLHAEVTRLTEELEREGHHVSALLFEIKRLEAKVKP